VHLLEVGFVPEGLTPGAVRLALGRLTRTALAGPRATLGRPLQPHRLLVVVALERPGHFIAAACGRAVGG